MTEIIAFADANGVIGFSSTCPSHALGFAQGPRETVETIVQEFADKLDGSLVVPNFGPTTDNIASLIAFGAKVRAACKTASEPDARSVRDRLDVAREFAAQQAFEAYDFPTDVANTTGWEHTVPGEEWRRNVFLEGDAPDAPSVLGVFVVTFTKDTASIADLSFTNR